MADVKLQKSPASAYDFTDILAQFMDRHMVLSMLDFIQEKKIHPENEVAAARVQLISKTKMVDFYHEEYAKLHNTKTLTPEQEQQKKEVYAQLQEWKVPCGALLAKLSSNEAIAELKQRGSDAINILREAGVTDDQVRALYRYAKLCFDCGRYPIVADYLYFVRLLSNDQELKFNALWGKLAAEILMNSEAAADSIDQLRDAIDSRPGNDHIAALQQRAWLLHWSLFVYFNVENGPNSFIELVFQDSRLLNALQTTCPHLLRYLTCAGIINKRRKNILKELVKVITQEKQAFADPITSFLQCLYVEFDFEAAHAKLQECEVMLRNDFFLSDLADDILDSARHLVFETYARTHHCIDIDLLARRLDIKVDQKDSKDAKTAPTIEQKLVELIRNSRVEVKIDSKKNQIVVDPRHPSIYQQVLDKTEAETLQQKTEMLLKDIEKLSNADF